MLKISDTVWSKGGKEFIYLPICHYSNTLRRISKPNEQNNIYMATYVCNYNVETQ